jgi:hypothetical protein
MSTPVSPLFQRLQHAGAVTVLAIAAFGAHAAHADSRLPPIQHSGPVQYLSGGIGDGESSAIQNASKQWPLTLEFAIKTSHGAEYAADVGVQIKDNHGQVTLDTQAQGPFLLAKLPPGAYNVDATLGGKTLHEHVLVRPGQHAKAVMVWPAGAN